MPYYKDINTLFIHIPKTGGTSLEEYLKTKSTQTIYSILNEGNILYEKYNIETHSLQHLTYNEIYKYKDLLNIDINDNLKILTIVRNPYDRAISALFFHKLIDKNTNKNEIYKILKKFIYSNKYDSHNIPQYKFLLENNDNDNNIKKDIIIFKTEDLRTQLNNYGYTDFNDTMFCYQSNLPISNDSKYSEYLNKESIQLINDFYKKDFEIFNYTYFA